MAGELLHVRLMGEFTPVLLSSDWVIGILVPSLCFSHISSHGNTGFSQIFGDLKKRGKKHDPEVSGNFVKRVDCVLLWG